MPSRHHRDSLRVPPECLVSRRFECGPEALPCSTGVCVYAFLWSFPGEAVGPGFSFGCPRGLGTGLARRRGSATLRQMISSRISSRRGPHRVPQSDSVVARNFSKLAGPFRYHRDSRLVPPECLISRRSYGGKGEDRTLQIPSRFPPCPTRVPSI